MKRTLLTVLAVAFFATTAKAGLRWSLEECIQHYGKPEYTNSDPFTDLLWYHFKTKGFEIQALPNDAGKVVGITYFSHEMSEQDINSLLAGNAPKAEWQKRSSKNSASWGEETAWIGLEDGSRKLLGTVLHSIIQTPTPRCTALYCWKSKHWMLKNCGKVITSVRANALRDL